MKNKCSALLHHTCALVKIYMFYYHYYHLFIYLGSSLKTKKGIAALQQKNNKFKAFYSNELNNYSFGF